MGEEVSGQQTPAVPDSCDECIAEAVSAQPKKAKPSGMRRILGVLTVIFLLAAVVLAVMLGAAMGEVNSLRADKEAAENKAAMLEQNASKVASELVELAKQAAENAWLQASFPNTERARAEVAASRTFLDMAEKLDRGAASSTRQATTERLKEVDNVLNPATEEGAPQEGQPAPAAPAEGAPAAAPEAAPQAPVAPPSGPPAPAPAPGGPEPAPSGAGPGGPAVTPQ